MSTQLNIETVNTILYCKRWRETVEFYQYLLELPVTFTASWFVEFSLSDTTRLSVADERRLSDAGLAPIKGPADTWRAESFDVTRAALEAFARAATGEAPVPIPYEELVHGVAVTEAIIASASEKRPQRVASTGSCPNAPDETGDESFAAHPAAAQIPRSTVGQSIGTLFQSECVRPMYAIVQDIPAHPEQPVHSEQWPNCNHGQTDQRAILTRPPTRFQHNYGP